MAREPERAALAAVAEMLRRPVAVGELRRLWGPGESFEPGHRYAAPQTLANGSSRR